MLRKAAMLQPPLTLPCASPWDPCIGALPLVVREQSSTIMSSSLSVPAPVLTEPRDSHEASTYDIVVGREVRPRPGPKCLISPAASFSIARTLPSPLRQRTRPAWDGALPLGSSRSTKLRGGDATMLGGATCSLQKLAADWRTAFIIYRMRS